MQDRNLVKELDAFFEGVSRDNRLNQFRDLNLLYRLVLSNVPRDKIISFLDEVNT